MVRLGGTGLRCGLVGPLIPALGRHFACKPHGTWAAPHPRWSQGAGQRANVIQQPAPRGPEGLSRPLAICQDQLIFKGRGLTPWLL